jgi:predicted RNA binding protein YcfA (HicA-like mRNA interferase family)
VVHGTLGIRGRDGAGANTTAGDTANSLDWRIEDLEAVARGFGIKIRRPGGSHVQFTHPRVREAVSMPARRPIKPAYVRALVRSSTV